MKKKTCFRLTPPSLRADWLSSGFFVVGTCALHQRFVRPGLREGTRVLSRNVDFPFSVPNCRWFHVLFYFFLCCFSHLSALWWDASFFFHFVAFAFIVVYLFFVYLKWFLRNEWFSSIIHYYQWSLLPCWCPSLFRSSIIVVILLLLR